MAASFPTSVRFSKKVKADLKKFAEMQGCSVTWLLNHIAEEWIKWKKVQDNKK